MTGQKRQSDVGFCSSLKKNAKKEIEVAEINVFKDYIDDSKILTDLNIDNKIDCKDIELSQDPFASGGQGSVFLGKYGEYGTVAVKQLALQLKDNYKTKLIAREITTLQKIRHATLVELLGVSFTEVACWLVLEYIPGKTLSKFVGNSNALTLAKKNYIGTQIAEGIAYLHTLPNPIIHGDIKPGNIIIQDDLKVKICDLGFAKLMKMNQDIRSAGDNCMLRGTLTYLAPEVLNGDTTTMDSDVWSLACTFLELYNNKYTWGTQSKTELEMLILFDINSVKGPAIPEDVTNPAVPLFLQSWLNKAFVYGSSSWDRPGARELLTLYRKYVKTSLC